MPEKIGNKVKVTGGYTQEVGITEEDIESISPDVAHLLEVAGGDPSVAIEMVAYVLDAVVAHFIRADVESVLGFPIPDEDWPVLRHELGHFNEHVLVCHVPLVQELIKSCWDEIHKSKEGPSIPPRLQTLYEKITGGEWRITGD